jgi:hypothetical protein
VIITSLASFDVVKWISSVLARSNCIVFSEASLYIILISRYSILVFFRRLIDFVVIEISSIYEMYLTRPELAWGVSNRLRIYIRKRISETGLPWGILVFIGKKSSIWLSKESRRVRLLRNNDIYEIRENNSLSSLRVDKSLFLDIWSKAPLISRNKVVVLCFSCLLASILFVRSKAVSIVDFLSLLFIWELYKRPEVSAR